MGARWIHCKVWPGMFTSERMVVIEEPGGAEVTSIFVDERLVEADAVPSRAAAVCGRLRVEIGPLEGGRVNVFLPVASERGRVISLPSALVVA